MYASISFQNVTNIRAKTFAELESTPLIITMEGTDIGYGHGEIILHVVNKKLALALVDAINEAVAENAAEPAIEDSSDAV